MPRRRIALAGVAIALAAFALATALDACRARAASTDATEWTRIAVPGSWEEAIPRLFADYDGFAWYRCRVAIPETWDHDRLVLSIDQVGDAHEAYFNGRRIGASGRFPPQFASGRDRSQQYEIPPDLTRTDRPNVVAIRVYNHNGPGGFLGPAPVLLNDRSAIELRGSWEFHRGDLAPQVAAAVAPETIRTPGFSRIEDAFAVAERNNKLYLGGPLSPADALRRFTVADDLSVQLVLAEPTVRQPLFVRFDERGRLWVVQYLQYPYPAGLKMLSKDRYWRAVYDKVPPPPPNHFRGRDKITIHEDTDGDGRLDRHHTFLDGLNIATSFARGRGGVWVLNPPYLLFYPDRDRDDVPDGAPEVHLEGFGLEDTHSVANSLTWGPDGWLYGAQGSTVSAAIRRPGSKDPPVRSMGQLIWRYHPETRRYEIFAEGGGNAFGLEIDARGWIYSGYNGGNARGFHYVQGGYYRKGFAKHGPLSNPFAFGFFEAMPHHPVPRFTHTFVIYQADALPERYRGKLFGVEPLQGQIVLSEIKRHGSTMATRDIERPLTSDDPRFRPVDITVGPDGAVYIADFYEPRISHRQHFEGRIDRDNGRIYRLAARHPTGPPQPVGDLATWPTPKLLQLLEHPNKWWRRTALRLLYDRRDRSSLPVLVKALPRTRGQTALEYLWAINAAGGFTPELACRALQHPEPAVREWTVRLLGDPRRLPEGLSGALARLAATEPDVTVRAQLACSARRLPFDQGWPIVQALLARDEDTADPFVPLLLWWAVERFCTTDPDRVVQQFEQDRTLWSRPLVAGTITQRLMRRFAQAGSRTDLLRCARLLDAAPTPRDQQRLMRGFEQAFAGRSLGTLPEPLVRAIGRSGGGSLVLRLRQKDPRAIEQALSLLPDPNTPADRRREIIEVLGQVEIPRCVPVLLRLLADTDAQLQQAALTALRTYADERIPASVLAAFPKFDSDTRRSALMLFATRPQWLARVLDAVQSEQIDPDDVPRDVIPLLAAQAPPPIAARIRSLWPDVSTDSSVALQNEVRRWQDVLRTGHGDPYRGKQVFLQTCGKCHMLFGTGGRIGPDLTTYERRDTLRLLINIVNPNAEIREGFETYLALTTDGRTVSGFLFDQDNQVVVLRGADGQNVTIPRDEVETLQPLKRSLMPEGLLTRLNDQQVRDLFAFLRSAQPLND